MSVLDERRVKRMYNEQNEACKSYAWRTVSGVVLAWEGVAAISKALKGDKALSLALPSELRALPEIPYITEVVRGHHPIVRYTATALVTVVVADHFGKRRVF